MPGDGANCNDYAPIGVLGGTFDPVHSAHLAFAAEAIAALGLAQVLWIPAGNPPHREPPRAPAEHRLAMVKTAICGDSRFVLDDSEVRSAAPSYTFTTLLRLRDKYGQRPLVLLVGADAFHGFAGWHRWHELFDLAHVAIATRPGYVLDASNMNPALRDEYLKRRITDPSGLVCQAAGSIITFAITPMNISATAIREKLNLGDDARDLLPETVLDYIAEHKLYSTTTKH